MSEAEAALKEATGGVTSEAIAWFLVVLLSLFAIYCLFCNVRKNIRDEKKYKAGPIAAMQARLDRHDQLFDNDNRRINRHDDKLADSDKFQGVMCRVMLAQLNHELSGNDVSHLKAARDELTDYLTQR